VQWRAPTVAVEIPPSTVASPAQVRAILAQVSSIRPPEVPLVAFFGCCNTRRCARPVTGEIVRSFCLSSPPHTYIAVREGAAAPLRLVETESSPEHLADEILALTKMNWNQTQLDARQRITIRTADQVGEMLRHLDRRHHRVRSTSKLLRDPGIRA
jgi:hypothetical protein